MHDPRTRETDPQGQLDFDGGEALDGSGFESEMSEPEFDDTDREDRN